ncbi:hypothetical protein ETAA8_07610 [Anatilimnocola aggregata]|uniref:Uncharacterized protein n=1 Tax=Anatilimnocola aggregata TaxID=2528021 RepID=A0A517Y629_9BACT|nr:hypothetical protein ETAA8_07610 [Anatilimnocola aggregata]
MGANCFAQQNDRHPFSSLKLVVRLALNVIWLTHVLARVNCKTSELPVQRPQAARLTKFGNPTSIGSSATSPPSACDRMPGGLSTPPFCVHHIQAILRQRFAPYLLNLKSSYLLINWLLWPLICPGSGGFSGELTLSLAAQRRPENPPEPSRVNATVALQLVFRANR